MCVYAAKLNPVYNYNYYFIVERLVYKRKYYYYRLTSKTISSVFPPLNIQVSTPNDTDYFIVFRSYHRYLYRNCFIQCTIVFLFFFS